MNIYILILSERGVHRAFWKIDGRCRSRLFVLPIVGFNYGNLQADILRPLEFRVSSYQDRFKTSKLYEAKSIT